MRETIAFILSVLMMVATVSAQNPPQKAAGAAAQAKAPESTLSAETILEKYVQALGGRATFAKLTSRVSKGTTLAVDEGAEGNVEIYEKAPNKYFWSGQYEGYGTVRQAFDGSAGWAESPDGGLVDIPGSRIAALVRSFDFYRETKLKDLYPQLAVTGKQQVDNRDVYVIEATATDGTKEQWSFDVETGLLVKLSQTRTSPQGSYQIETILGDYREVDGIKLPFTQRRKDPQRTVITKLSEVKHNVEIDDAKFARPTKP